MRTTKEQTQEYFEILVNHQPETVVEILMNLYSKGVDIDEWIDNTSNDIVDSLD